MSSRLVRPPLAITDGQGSRQVYRGLDIDAGEHAVAPDVGIDHGADAVILKFLCQIHHVVAGHLGPAVDRHLAFLGVEADDDLAGKGIAGLVQEAGVLDRRGAEDNEADAVVEITLDGRQVADAATQLHRNLGAHLLDDGANGFLVHRLAGKGAVEVHQVQAAPALFDPVPGHFGRVFGKDRGRIHLALFQAHAMAVFQINCGNH
jgi:hypothetical protein